MALFPKLVISAPKKSHHNLSHYFDTSMAPGLLYPIACIPVNAGDEHRIDVESLVNTQALLSPLYGSYRLEVSGFFAGISLYVPKLWHNADMRGSTMSGPLNQQFPFFRVKAAAGLNATTHLSESHILSFLGHGVGKSIFPGSSTATGTGTEWNAIPLLMYYDIFRNYFMNRQEDSFFIATGVEGADNVSLESHAAYTMDSLFTDLPKNGGDVSNLLAFIDNGILDGANFQKKLFGLVTTCYPKDRMTVFLNKSFAQSNYSTMVSTANGGFQIDQLVTAKKIWDSFNKDQMISPVFKDWVRAHFGVTPKIMDDIPTYLGSSYSELYFEDIRATTNGYTMQGETPYTNFIGDKASSGKGYVRSRIIRCFADRPGFIMVMARLVPRPKYFQFDDRYTRWTSLADMFRPEYNGIGLQDLLVSDMCVDCSKVTDANAFTQDALAAMYTTSVGKQPAWLEYMTAVDKVRGTFCSTESSWVLLRDFMKDAPAGTFPDKMPFPTSYINPGDWNQPFAVQDANAQNFLAQFYIKHTTRSTVAKRLLPWL